MTVRFAVLAAALAGAVASSLTLRTVPKATAAAGAPRTLTLYALMPQGIWTDEPVTAANAWRRDFRPARPVLRAGETVVLRLGSADVVHSFAIPDLGVDPVEVHPGRFSSVTLTPSRTGTFRFYCTVVCGERHFAMQGEVVVTAGGVAIQEATTPMPRYWEATVPPAGGDAVARGHALFRRSGCVTCHGEEGGGGVPNPNSMNATVKELRTLAARTFLYSRADVRAFLDARSGAVPSTSVPLYPIVEKQYLATRDVVRQGRRSSRLDPAGPQPPLDMPAWEARLDENDVDDILTYLLTLPDAAPRTARTVANPAR